MGAERRGSKGVGGFLQLFDWNSKSKKKLFANKSNFPDEGKRSDRSLPVTIYDHVDEEESRAASSVKGSSEYSCASSVVDDDGYGGVRGPSVVARLMGLDSMPTSNCSEPSSTPLFGSRSSHHQRENMEIDGDNQMQVSSHITAEGQSRCTFYTKPRKRPIEKFQSEVLPPRSAKSIPITHHKLLSPIKSSGMFYTGDAAHIMEAAAKIIQSGSQAIGMSKMPLVGSSSSLPIKVRDLKEKVRATQEKVEAVQEKASSGYSSTSFRMRDKERVEAIQEKTSIGYSSSSFRMKDRERADAVQEKTGAGYASSSSCRMRNKERADAADEIGCNAGGSFRAREGRRKSSRLESNAAKYLKGQCMNKSLNWSADTMPLTATSVVCDSNKGKSVSLAIQAKVNVQKREGSRLTPWRKEQAEVKNKKFSMQNAACEVLRQNNQRQNNATEKDMPNSSSYLRGKKAVTADPPKLKTSEGSSRTRKINLEAKNNEGNEVKNVPRKKRNIEGNQNGEKANMDRYAWIEDSRKKGMDVVSFTFTSPMTPSSQMGRGKKLLPDSDCKISSSLGLNVVGGDALSFLLEQKLREVTSAIPLSPTRHIFKSDFESNHLSGFECGVQVDSLLLRNEPKLEGVEDVDACSSSNHAEAENGRRRRHHLPSPVSVLEGSSFSTESCNSSDSAVDSSNKRCSSSVQACGVRRFEADLSDSASSISPGTSKWEELSYVKQILSNADVMFEKFSIVGLAGPGIIFNPELFEELENCRGWSAGGSSKLERKMYFDCVGESLEWRCRRYVGGGCEAWCKGMSMLKRKDRLAEQVCKEISGLSGMAECMVDELVDNDMHVRKWLNFEPEQFSLGAEIEARILDFVLDELVADILLQ